MKFLNKIIMKKNRVIIAGSRTCPEWDSEIVGKVVNILTHMQPEETEIVSGTCKGGDKLGERIAHQLSYNVKKFPADWDRYGKAAGQIRNKEMADYGTHLIAIVDLQDPCKGTRGMIQFAKDAKLPIRVIYINFENPKFERIKL